MKCSMMIGAALCCGVLCASSVSAAVYINQDFEGYTLNQSFTGQNTNWSKNLHDGGTDNVVQDMTTDNGTKVLQLVESQANARGVYTNSGTFDNISGKISASVDVMLPTSSDRISLRFVDANDSNAKFQLYVRSSGFIVSDPDGNITMKDQSGNTVTATAGVWYHIETLMDIDSVAADANVSTFNMTVTKLGDGSAVGALSGNIPGDPTSIGQAYLYADGQYTVYYDNVSVHPIPEPASLGLLGISGLLMMRRRRK